MVVSNFSNCLSKHLHIRYFLVKPNADGLRLVLSFQLRGSVFMMLPPAPLRVVKSDFELNMFELLRRTIRQ